MRNIKKLFISVLFISLFMPVAGQAANQVDIYFFEGQGCPHCAKMKSYLEGMKADYPNLNVKDFEVYFDKNNQDLFTRMLAAYNSDVNGVPVVFIGEEVIVGENYGKLKEAVEKCSSEKCISPIDKLGPDANINNNINSELTNTNQPIVGSAGKNEIVGWVVIGVFSVLGVGLIIYMLKGKKNV